MKRLIDTSPARLERTHLPPAPSERDGQHGFDLDEINQKALSDHGGIPSNFDRSFGVRSDQHQIDTRTNATKNRDAADTHNAEAASAIARAQSAMNEAAGKGENPQIRSLTNTLNKLVTHLEDLTRGNKNDARGKQIEEIERRLDRLTTQLKNMR